MFKLTTSTITRLPLDGKNRRRRGAALTRSRRHCRTHKSYKKGLSRCYHSLNYGKFLRTEVCLNKEVHVGRYCKVSSNILVLLVSHMYNNYAHIIPVGYV